MCLWTGRFCLLSVKPALITSASFSPHLHAGFLLATHSLTGMHAYPCRSSGQHPGHLPNLSGVQGCLKSYMKLQGQLLAISTLKCVSSRCYLSSIAWCSPKVSSPLIKFIVALDRSLKQSVGNEELWGSAERFVYIDQANSEIFPISCLDNPWSSSWVSGISGALASQQIPGGWYYQTHPSPVLKWWKEWKRFLLALAPGQHLSVSIHFITGFRTQP